jgi:hypothetical protein
MDVRGGRRAGQKREGLGHVQLGQQLHTVGFDAAAVETAIAEAVVPRLAKESR